jgi:hypothetical protein
MAKADIVDEIIRLCRHGIPCYAYGDNQAACEMSTRLHQIYELACSLDLKDNTEKQ